MAESDEVREAWEQNQEITKAELALWSAREKALAKEQREASGGDAMNKRLPGSFEGGKKK